MTPTVHLTTKKDEDKDKDKDKDKVLKRLSICYIFGKQGVQGYQISHPDQSTGQLFVGQSDQTRKDFNLADLILELSFLLNIPPL